MIEIRNLKKYYPMGETIVRALDGVDLSVKEGEFLSLTGASGSGKSTMMHVIGCLDRPSEGEYHLAGQRVDKIGDRRRASIRNQYIGFVFQTFNLVQRTPAVDNVMLPMIYARKSGARKRALAALERVGLRERAGHRPSELSGGERQRVAIARALVNNPPVLLADEPTGNLDSRTGEQILDLFHELHDEGVTILLVTHEMAVAAQAQRVVRMKDGRIISDRQVDDTYRAELLGGGMQLRGQSAKSAEPVVEGVQES